MAYNRSHQNRSIHGLLQSVSCGKQKQPVEGGGCGVQESRQRPDVLELLLHPFITAVQPSLNAPTTDLQVMLRRTSAGGQHVACSCASSEEHIPPLQQC